MSNDYYNASGTPAQSSSLSSPPIRSENSTIAAGFDKLPPLTGNAYEIVYINASGSAMVSVGGDGLLKISTTGIPSVATPGTDYVTSVEASITAASAAAIADTDNVPFVQTSVAGALKKITWSSVKSTLNALYLALSGGTLTGKLIFKVGLNNIASAATVDLTVAGAGNTVHITGTTGISAWTMTSGQVVDVVFDGILLLTHHATNNNLPGAANITTAANDRARLWYDGTAVWVVGYQKASGAAVVGSSSVQLQPISASVGSSALTISASALSLDFRSATLTSGAVTTVSGTPANLVVPSTATLGTISGVTHRLLVLALNYNSTIELAVVNNSNVVIEESGVITTTTIDTASDTAGVAYSTTGRTGVAYRIVGAIDIAEATPGTWASNPTLIQGEGGLATMKGALTQGAAATLSGNATTITGIPAWATQITIGIVGMSTSGTSAPVIRLGTASGIRTSTYSGGSHGSQTGGGANGIAVWATDSGICLHYGNTTIGAAGDTRHGQIILTRLNHASHIWSVSGSCAQTTGTAQQANIGGSVTLDGAIISVQAIILAGGESFDAGSMNVSWG